jgi:hypothetical protein
MQAQILHQLQLDLKCQILGGFARVKDASDLPANDVFNVVVVLQGGMPLTPLSR